MRTMRYWRVIVYALFALCRLSGTVVIQPSFGQLLIYTDRIVFTSVDGKSLIGIDKEGNQKWELQFPQQIYENRWNDKFLLVQSGREVFQVDVQQGARSRLVMMPEFQFLIAHGDDHSFLAAFDSRFDHHRVEILDSSQYTVVWESPTIESILQVTPASIVAVTADREVVGRGGYALKNAAVSGFSRSDGRVRWSIPLSKSDTELVTSAASDHFLAVVERLRIIENGTGSTQLLILNPETGAVLYRLKGEFNDLSASGDSLMVLEEADGPGQARLYTCSLPECGRNPGLLLSAKEILRFHVHGDYILTWGIYDSACFSRATGKRLWQKGQIDWSEPFGSEMIAADFSSKGSKARIVSINLQTGAERVLFVRRVTKKDKTSFRPF